MTLKKVTREMQNLEQQIAIQQNRIQNAIGLNTRKEYEDYEAMSDRYLAEWDNLKSIRDKLKA